METFKCAGFDHRAFTTSVYSSPDLPAVLGFSGYTVIEAINDFYHTVRRGNGVNNSSVSDNCRNLTVARLYRVTDIIPAHTVCH
eukprot:g52416.t1